ncbi:hypothetical protein C4D60_Mb05t04030 [Musa balbisiana]|uniref:Uncharacterized protein n=1 Tax=Musa balbisiana TaxID=52838 RepID=A0A4S8JTL8_MUSBA|nr:hypothetical protein C4D60_Mb05t04030 [Musa balbisiana]
MEKPVGKNDRNTKQQQFTIAIFHSDLTRTVFFCPMKKSFQLEGQISEGYISQHPHSLITLLLYGLSQSSFTRAFNFLPQNSAVRDKQASKVSEHRTLSTHSNSASYSKKSIVVFFLSSIFVARLCE